MIRLRESSMLLAALLSGCLMQPAYVRPVAEIPATWPTGAAYLQQSTQGLPSYDWNQVFADPRLQAVIVQALANNQDLRLAAANIAAARAQYSVQKSELVPDVTGSADLSRSDGASGAKTNASLQVGVAGYELDLFGRLRSLNDAARSRYLGSVSAAQAVKLTLISDIADAWLSYGADRSLLLLAQQTAAAAQESVKLTQARYQGGIAPRSDVRQAEIVLATAQADVANQTTLMAQDVNALRLLVGAEVAPANLPGGIEDAAARIAAIAPGLDSTVLLRRPDVVEAEWQLRAADAEIGAARAALFPKISLTGLLGLATSALTSLFTGGAFTWTAGASASVPIFGTGAKANVRITEAQRDAALAQYQKVIQTAFRDVANALARRGTIADQLAAAGKGDAAAADNLGLADLRYRNGIDSYLSELTARLSRYSAARTLVQTRLLDATSKVAVYRAVGADASL
ncbi:MAG: efflux transporter outer membrane subunit [Novosphingobium sp.]